MAYTTINDPALYFQTKTYSGSNSDLSVTFDGENDMQPDLVWLKKTGGTGDHLIYDAVRGVNKRLQPNATDSEVDRSGNNDELKAFNCDGWTLGTFNSNVTGAGSVNVSWNWKESADAGFDIVSFTGSGDGTASTAKTVSHSLSAVPRWIMIKNRADSTNWGVYHGANTDNPETEIIYLNLSNATSDDNGFWNDTAPTSSVFTVGGDNGINGNSDAMIAYCWAPKQGYSKFGKYVGNGNANGTFVYTGFRPAFVLIKRTTGTTEWQLIDNKRSDQGGGFGNVIDEVIAPSTDDASYDEGTAGSWFADFYATGFKLRGAWAAGNVDGQTYIYCAFAESPTVNSNGVPTNAR